MGRSRAEDLEWRGTDFEEEDEGGNDEDDDTDSYGCADDLARRIRVGRGGAWV